MSISKMSELKSKSNTKQSMKLGQSYPKPVEVALMAAHSAFLDTGRLSYEKGDFSFWDIT